MNDPHRELLLRSPWNSAQASEALELAGSLNPMQLKRLITLACEGWSVKNAVAQLRR